MTCRPSCASWRQMAAPITPLPPVTNARLISTPKVDTPLTPHERLTLHLDVVVSIPKPHHARLPSRQSSEQGKAVRRRIGPQAGGYKRWKRTGTPLLTETNTAAHQATGGTLGHEQQCYRKSVIVGTEGVERVWQGQIVGHEQYRITIHLDRGRRFHESCGERVIEGAETYLG